MGMSASQMRYCLITGKKNDVEFQGQQINQQRTTLSTQSSSLNTQLLSMSVPTPPSTSDYTKTTYSFASDGNTKTISNVKYNSDKTYDINYSYNTTGTAVKTGQSNIFNNGGVYSTGQTADKSTKLTKYPSSDGTDADTIKANLQTIYGDDFATNGQSYYYYKSESTYRFMTASQLSAVNDGKSGSVTYSYAQDDSTITQTGSFSHADVNWSNSGRMNTITTKDSNGKSVTYSLTTTTTTDEVAYTDAYNEYQYKKEEYELGNNKINAQISIIQNQDKNLELKLQSLDTQQQALSTEMDSVKKVIDKNIESSFKAFSA